MPINRYGAWTRRTFPVLGAILIALFLFTQTGHAAALSSVWSVVNSPNVTTGQFADNTFLGVAALSDSNVWAVGSESTTGADPSGEHPLAEHWNGSRWSIVLAGPQTAVLNAVSAASSTDVWAVGNTLVDAQQDTTAPFIEHWNGSAWSVVPSPSPIAITGANSVTLQGVSALAANNAWAVGWSFDNTANLIAPLIEHWNGSAWSVFSNVPTEQTGVTFLNGITAISANDIWAVGDFTSDNGDSINLAMHWDGTTWSLTDPAVLIDQGSNETLQGVSAVSHTDVWAVGNDMDTQNNQQPFAIHWNGSTWKQIATPHSNRNGGTSSQLTAVAALSSSDVWAVGIDGLGGFLEHWNGSSWSLAQTPTLGPSLGGGAPSSTLFGVARSATSSLWAVGTTDPQANAITTDTLTIHTTQG